MISVSNLTFDYAGKTILSGASAALPLGAKVALVGANGAGKSTFLKLLDGLLTAGQGDIEIPQRVRLQRLKQEIPRADLSVLDVVLSAHEEMAALQQLIDTEDADPMDIAEAHNRLYELGAHSAEAKAKRLLRGLGFSEAEMSQPIGTFSGGWQMRASLAGLLFAEPDYMLLDEPTNYLDLEGALWLERYLAGYPYGWVLVSHDKDMLNTAPDNILHLGGGKLNLYSGNYDSFMQQNAERQRLTEKANAKRAAQRAEMEQFIERFRAKASKAKQAQSRIKALARLGEDTGIVRDKHITFHFPEVTPLPPPMLTLEDASVGYAPNQPVLSQLNLRLDNDDRIALLGPNGRGKSTFAKLLSDRLAPLSGTVKRSSKLKIGFFTQHQMDELGGDDTPLEHIARVMPGSIPSQQRARLAQFGFDADMVERRVASLSGGERARLLFAIICADDPQFLILDEPTNHLDIAAREELAKAIGRYNGAVLMISHDRSLLDLCADRLWIVEDGTVKTFEGSLEDYRKQVLAEEKRGDATVPLLSQNKKQARQDAAHKRSQLAPLKKAAKTAEAEHVKLSKKAEYMRRQLEDPELYADADQTETARLQKQLGMLEKQIEEAELAWLEAQQAYEEGLS
ncbi:MAG: ABC-F family ATP-binding cassette domain-containing protein [Pseudomonadota bacterium]